MRHLLVGVTAAITIAVIGPVWGQVAPPGARQPWPPTTYSAPYQRYPFPGLAPRDAYREGLITAGNWNSLKGRHRRRCKGRV